MSHLLTRLLAQPLKLSSLYIIGSLIAYMFFFSTLYAQDKKATKLGIAVVDARVIYQELPSYQALQDRITQLEKEAEQRLASITQDNKDIIEAYQNKQKRLKNIDINKSDRQQLVEQQQQLKKELEQVQSYLQQEHYRLTSSIQAVLANQLIKDQHDLKSQLTQLAQEQGYEILLDSSVVTKKQTPVVYYHADKFDKTELFLSLLLADS